MKRGIYLVANFKSQDQCANLIYSIRESGCKLPIRIIHFGGKKITSDYILNNVDYVLPKDFPPEAIDFISKLQEVLSDCPLGFLYRFLAFFSDWDEFIYSDNDVVALLNWEKLFDFLEEYDIVHADEEYKTKGRFNHYKPQRIMEIFGSEALESAFTAGHFVIKRKRVIIEDMIRAISWYRSNPGIAKNQDQALLHISLLLGKWKVINLCKPPHNWLSSWSGDYLNSYKLILSINNDSCRNISHIHYSGSTPLGNMPIEDLLYSNLSNTKRLDKYFLTWAAENLWINYLVDKIKRIRGKYNFF